MIVDLVVVYLNMNLNLNLNLNLNMGRMKEEEVLRGDVGSNPGTSKI